MNHYKYLVVIFFTFFSSFANCMTNEHIHDPNKIALNNGWTKTEYQRNGITTHTVTEYQKINPTDKDRFYIVCYTNLQPTHGRASVCNFVSENNKKLYKTLLERDLSPEEISFIHQLSSTRIRNSK
ncbi:MAG: hypothetical protein ACXWL5_02345 [Candidatus Chromulinivorax sp.]